MKYFFLLFFLQLHIFGPLGPLAPGVYSIQGAALKTKSLKRAKRVPLGSHRCQLTSFL